MTFPLSMDTKMLLHPTFASFELQHPLKHRGFPGGSDSKEFASNARDLGSTTGSGRSPREGNGYPLQCSCLENSMYRGLWRATVHGVEESDTAELLSLTKREFLCFSALFLKENILFEACTTASLEESVVFRIVIWRNKTQM